MSEQQFVERRQYDLATNEKLSSINIRLTEIQGELNLLKRSIESASKDDSNHEEELTELRKAVSTLEKLTSELQREYKIHDGQITAIHTEMKNMRGDIKDIGQAVQKAGWLISAFISLGGIILPLAINYFLK